MPNTDHEEMDNSDDAINFFTIKTKQCNYYDTASIPASDPTTGRLFALHVNIRSLKKNLEDLCHLLAEMSTLPNLICLSETCLKDSTDFRLVNLPTYKIVAKEFYNKSGRSCRAYLRNVRI